MPPPFLGARALEEARECAADPDAPPLVRVRALALLSGSSRQADASAVASAAVLELGSGDDAAIVGAAAGALSALPGPLLPAVLLRRDVTSAIKDALAPERSAAVRAAAARGIGRGARAADPTLLPPCPKRARTHARFKPPSLPPSAKDLHNHATKKEKSPNGPHHLTQTSQQPPPRF